MVDYDEYVGGRDKTALIIVDNAIAIWSGDVRNPRPNAAYCGSNVDWAKVGDFSTEGVRVSNATATYLIGPVNTVDARK